MQISSWRTAWRARAIAVVCVLGVGSVFNATGCATNPPTRTGSSVASVQSPTERYESYRAALAKAAALEELLPLTSHAVRDEMAKRPPAYRKAILKDLQSRDGGDLRVVDERVDGDVATLTVEGTQVVDAARGLRSHGRASVVLLRQDGAWRVDEEIWTLEGDSRGELGPAGWAAPSAKPPRK